MSERPDPPIADAEQGIWQGRSVARRFVSPDGFTVLVGRSAADNDVLTFKLGEPRDAWLHVAAGSGSHVIVRNPEGLERMPRDTLRFAAALAARYSKAKHGGNVTVHMATCADVSKPRGLLPGQVQPRRFSRVQGSPSRAGAGSSPTPSPCPLPPWSERVSIPTPPEGERGRGGELARAERLAEGAGALRHRRASLVEGGLHSEEAVGDAVVAGVGGGDARAG